MRLILGFVISLWASLALAQNVTNPTDVGDSGAYNASPPTCTTGNHCRLQTDVNGNLKTVPSGTPTGTQDVNLKNYNGSTVSATNPQFVLPVVSASTGAAFATAASTVAGTSLVLKASAGNLYSITATIGGTSGYLLLFDATSLPVDGAVTPVWCYPVNSNGTNGAIAATFPTPLPFATGITAGFSTTGCFTKTAANASYFGGYK